jgi:hypothetical protein
MIRRSAAPEWRWGPGNLPRHDDLDVRDQRVAGYARQFGVGQPQNPAFGLRGPYQFGRPHCLRPQIPPVPDVGHGLAARLDADAAADPGRRDVLRAQLRVIILQLFWRRLDIRKFQHRRSSLFRGRVDRAPARLGGSREHDTGFRQRCA